VRFHARIPPPKSRRGETRLSHIFLVSLPLSSTIRRGPTPIRSIPVFSDHGLAASRVSLEHERRAIKGNFYAKSWVHSLLLKGSTEGISTEEIR
jgi:hypothetical protein